MPKGSVLKIQTNIGETKNIETLIDTGASASFVSQLLVDKLRQENWQMQIHSCNISLNLADNTTATANGLVTLPVAIDDAILDIRFYVMSQLAYPLILGCAFLEQHNAVLQFSKDNRKIEFTKFNSSNLYLLNTTEIPAYSQKLVECSVDPNVKNDKIYTIEPNNELFHHSGLLVARGITRLSDTNMVVAIANVTKEKILIQEHEKLASLEIIDATSIISIDNHNPNFLNTLEADKISSSETRQECINRLNQQIPKLDVNFTPFCDQEVQQIVNTLTKYVDVFDDGKSKYGAAKDVQHVINTGHAKPISQPPHRVSPIERKVIREMTDDMLERGAIQPSTSPWASPVVLVKKKDGKQRFCIDFRKLNQVTTRDVYPIPRIDDCLQALGGNILFSTFDLFAGYWQIAMSESDKQKTAFIIDSGLYEFNVMPFGLTNATATFQRYMDLVLAGLKWSSLLVYLDDICVFATTLTEHLQRLEEMFLRKFKLKLNA